MDVYKLDKFEHIYAVDCFDKEFSKMTNERLSDEPPYPRFQKWLISRLSILDKMGKNAIKLEGFEDLASNNPKLFSIRYPVATGCNRTQDRHLRENRPLKKGIQTGGK